jgi:hypothetical protein
MTMIGVSDAVLINFEVKKIKYSNIKTICGSVWMTPLKNMI